MELDQRVTALKTSLPCEVDDFIKEYLPFILSTASRKIGRYIEMENDEAYSLALQSFYKAVQNFNEEKGHFLPFAKLLIERDLLNLIQKEQPLEPSIEDLPLEDPQGALLEHYLLKEEIEVFTKELERFGVSLEDLVDLSPKHQDTRENAKKLAISIHQDQALRKSIFSKCTLPVTRIALRFQVSRKMIYGSREYILSILVVLEKNLTLLQKWI